MVATPEARSSPWERFRAIRRDKGLMMGWIEEHSSLTRAQIRGFLNGVYGHPDTPEKRAEILRVLNLGPGDPVTEADIWPADAATEAE